MKILVSGREGQLAKSLIERSQHRPGITLRAIGRPELDLEDASSISRVVSHESPDVIINAAAYTAVDAAEDEPERAFRINGQAAGEMAAAARKAGARIIQISTDYVFDGRSKVPYRESAPTSPLAVYGKSKLEGERAVKSETADHVIVRTAWVYSPFGRNFLKTMMALAENRDTIQVVQDQRGNPSSALELADGLLAIVQRWREQPRLALSQTYHLAGTGSTTWNEFAEHVFAQCRLLGRAAANVEPILSSGWPTKAQRPGNSMLDSSKFARDIGFCMPEWRQSVQETIRRLASPSRPEHTARAPI